MKELSKEEAMANAPSWATHMSWPRNSFDKNIYYNKLLPNGELTSGDLLDKTDSPLGKGLSSRLLEGVHPLWELIPINISLENK